MKSCLIIPVHNQVKYLRNILEGVSKQSILPDITYVMLDRPSDDEYNMAIEVANLFDFNISVHRIDNIPTYIPRKSNNGIFLAGYIRNQGVSLALDANCDIFIFIDGDCVPQKDLISSHINKCSKSIPVMSIGRRRESKYGWKDQRETSPNLTHLNLFNTSGCIINNAELLKNCLVIWSCNLAVNKHALGLIYKFNNKYYGISELFNSIFLGEWGGEDSFLGITAWYCKLFITTIGEMSSGVEHIDHPRPDSKYTINHKAYFDEQLENIRKKTTLNPMDLEFYEYH